MAEGRTWNPLRSEEDAFQLLIAAIVYFAAIVVVTVLGGVWAGVAVFVVLSAAAVTWVVRRNRHPEPEARESEPSK
jgi:hypothetical protein